MPRLSHSLQFRKVIPVFLLGGAVALSGCGSTGTKVVGYEVKGDVRGLTLDESAAPTLLYTRPGAPSLSEYDRFIVDPVLIDYRDESMEEISPEDIHRIQRYFQDKVISELRDAGVQVATRSQPGTMRISFSLSGLSAPSASANVTAAVAPIALSVGEVTVEAVFSQADTTRVDAVVVATSKGSRMFNATPWSTWADVESALDRWARGIRESIESGRI